VEVNVGLQGKEITVPRHSRSFLDIAIMAMEDQQKPMGAAEIIAWARRKSYLHTAGKTPAKTLHAAISRSIANDPHTPFAKSGRAFRMRIGGGTYAKDEQN
jgi:hypothetical protein